MLSPHLIFIKVKFILHGKVTFGYSKLDLI